MGIKQPAHDGPAIDETIFDDFSYLSPARRCLPLAGTSIDLLVGYDHAYLFTALHTISASTNAERHPGAAYVRLGWTIYGGIIPQPRAVVSNVSSVNHARRLEEEDDLKTLFYSDVAGVKLTSATTKNWPKPSSRNTPEERPRSPTKEESEYACRGYPDALPFNKEKTIARKYQQENALKRKGPLEEYNGEIRVLLSQGFVRPLTPEEADDGRGWYLEHQAVYREDKSSTKIHIVWNTAAYKDVSLNDGFRSIKLSRLLSACLASRHC